MISILFLISLHRYFGRCRSIITFPLLWEMVKILLELETQNEMSAMRTDTCTARKMWRRVRCHSGIEGTDYTNYCNFLNEVTLYFLSFSLKKLIGMPKQFKPSRICDWNFSNAWRKKYLIKTNDRRQVFDNGIHRDSNRNRNLIERTSMCTCTFHLVCNLQWSESILKKDVPVDHCGTFYLFAIFCWKSWQICFFSRVSKILLFDHDHMWTKLSQREKVIKRGGKRIKNGCKPRLTRNPQAILNPLE